MKNNRPRLRIKPQKADLILETIGWAVILINWFLAIYYFSDLPDKIPVHYNLKGEVDSWGNKLSIFLLPLISTFLFAFITYLNYYPHVFNYPTKIHEGNAHKHYSSAVKLNRYMKLLIVIVFFLIDLRTIQIAFGHSGKITFWTVPIIVLIFIIPLSVLVVNLFKRD